MPDSQLTRISKEEMYMRMALILSARSTCQRKGSDGKLKRVGAIITNNDLSNILSVGYNGNAAGLPDECTNPDLPGNCGCLHAEENAISKCPSRERDKIMFATDSPCQRCAKFIINNGFSKVYYLRRYRDDTGIRLLEQVGIEIEELSLTKNVILDEIVKVTPDW